MLKLLSPEQLDAAQFRRGAGCDNCMNTGFMGRTALTEMLVADEVIRDAVMQKLPTRTLQQVAVQQGMVNLWQMGVNRVIKGETTLEEILRVVAVDQI